MKKDLKWLKNQADKLETTIRNLINSSTTHSTKTSLNGSLVTIKELRELINQLDEPEVLSQEWIDENKVARINNVRKMTTSDVVPVEKLKNLLVPKQEEVDLAYRKGFKEGERQTAEYFESITEEPSYAQVQKYLSEHGIKITDKEPETVADVVITFWKSYERLKEVMSMEVEEMEE